MPLSLGVERCVVAGVVRRRGVRGTGGCIRGNRDFMVIARIAPSKSTVNSTLKLCRFLATCKGSGIAMIIPGSFPRFCG